MAQNKQNEIEYRIIKISPGKGTNRIEWELKNKANVMKSNPIHKHFF